MTHSAPLKMGPVEWGMLLLLAALWGGSFLFNGIAVRELPTLTIVALRVGLAAIVLWGIVIVLKRHLPTQPQVWLAFLGMGLLNNVIPFCLIVWGQHTITSGLASILNATTPLCTVAVAGFFLRDEPITKRKLIGLLIGFSGVIVMIGPTALAGVARDEWAALACLGAALSYACASVFGRRFQRFGVDPIVVATGQVTASFLILAPFAVIFHGPLVTPHLATIGAILGLAVFSTALAYMLFFHILARAGATNISLVTFLVPVFAITLGAMVLQEQIQSVQLVGMAMIGMGLVAINGQKIGRGIGRKKS